MEVQGGPPVVAPAVRGADVVLVHLRQQRRAQHLHRHGDAGDGDGGGGEDQIAGALPEALRRRDEAPRHEPPQQQAEQVRQQDAGKEGRHRHQYLIHHRQGLIQRPAAVAGGEESQRDGQHHDQQKRQQGQKPRHGNFPLQHLAHRHTVIVRRAHVPPDEIPQPADVPLQKRAVQPQLLPQGLHPLRGGLFAQQLGGGVAGNDAKGQKGQK